MDGFIVSVEADVSGGLPGFSISGHLASEVRESQERVRTALRNSGFRLPARKITVNLSPAGVRKGGTAYDLAIAVAVLGAFEQMDASQLHDSFVVGELGLDGRVKPVNGVLSMVDAAREHGLKRCFLPVDNVREGMVIQGMDMIGVKSLEQMIQMLRKPRSIVPGCPPVPGSREEAVSYDVDFGDVNGQLVLKRAAEIAAAGMHGLLMSGSAGTGKTMVAKRIPTIMPALTREEDIEISKIYSICGMLPPGRPLLSRRPFRSPHHTITPQALTGGGLARPGELSLASGGILFLDELPHFGREAIDILRQPLEDRKVTVTRVHGNYEFPADFIMIAAINPCPCGFYPDRSRCRCTQAQIQKYLGRISRPVLNRFDICAQASMVNYEEMSGQRQDNEDSASMRKRVEAAVRMQKQRFEGSGIRFNSRMGPRDVAKYCVLEAKERNLLKMAYDSRGLSARRYHKALKVARTIADLEQSRTIQREHLAEALGYGMLEDKIWG